MHEKFGDSRKLNKNAVRLVVIQKSLKVLFLRPSPAINTGWDITFVPLHQTEASTKTVSFSSVALSNITLQSTTYLHAKQSIQRFIWHLRMSLKAMLVAILS